MKIEEGQAARRRAKARGEMGWPRFLSLKCECVDRPALPAGLWKSERIVREAMHESHEPSIGHLGGRQSYHSYSDRFVMQEAYLENSDCVSFAGPRWDAGRRCPPPTGSSQAGILAAHCARHCTAQTKTDTLGSVRLCRRPVRPGRGRAFSGAGPAPGTCLNDTSRLPGPGHRAVPRRGRSVPPAWPLRAPDGSHPVHPWR